MSNAVMVLGGAVVLIALLECASWVLHTLKIRRIKRQLHRRKLMARVTADWPSKANSDYEIEVVGRVKDGVVHWAEKGS